MGKGYNNYMCKKPFHPGSKANIKRAWMAEQKTDNEKKKQDELKVQYEKEQDLYNNKALISTESKDKLQLNFMYEAPPGAKRERQKEDDEPEYRFEWQRKYNAPREDYAKDNADIKDQPFGIPVRNVRCIKCHKWGHINTDRECPLFSQASTSSMPTTSMDPLELMRQMREDGYGLKQNVLGHHLNPQASNQQLISSDESDPEAEFLNSLSTEQKKKLLRKLNKLSKKQEKEEKRKSQKKHKSKSRQDKSSEDGEKKRTRSFSSSSDSSSDEHSPRKKVKKSKERKNSKLHQSKKRHLQDSSEALERQAEHNSRTRHKSLKESQNSNEHKGRRHSTAEYKNGKDRKHCDQESHKKIIKIKKEKITDDSSSFESDQSSGFSPGVMLSKKGKKSSHDKLASEHVKLKYNSDSKRELKYGNKKYLDKLSHQKSSKGHR